MCKDIIRSRKNMKDPPNDLLQCMIEASSQHHEVPNGQETDVDHRKSSSPSKVYKLSDEDILGNATGFMAAGYHTTSNALGFCAYFLSKHLEVQESVRMEIKKNFKPQEEIDYAGLANLQYMDQVISETLRFFPLALLGINRVCKEDFEYNGMTIPKGAVVAVPVWSLQRDPKYWKEPDKFIPERFSPENRGQIDQFVYQPFGTGPRVCIGMRLSTSIMKFTLANLLRNYRIESCDEGKELELEYTLFQIQAKNGIHVRVIPLEN